MAQSAISTVLASSELPRGYIDGLILSNNGTDANNDIDISAGYARDGTNVYNMILSATMTKRLDAAWAVGSGNGGLDTGSEAASTWYHVWLIRKDSDGTIDALFSASATAPTMPSGYTAKRRIGAVRNDASSNILAFKQSGDEFLWVTVPIDVNVTDLGTTPTLYVLSVPTGVKNRALVTGYFLHSANGHNLSVSAPDQTAGNLVISTNPVAAAINGTQFFLYFSTNTSSQIRALSTGTSTTLVINTRGWIDPRGKDA